MSFWRDDQSWRDGYDAWKLMSPDQERGYYEEDPEPQFCDACSDSGWTWDENDRIVACTECRQEPLTEDDIAEIECGLRTIEEKAKCQGCRPVAVGFKIEDKVPF
jgi:hypothetical protein